MIPFGEWLPDQADLDNPGVTVAKNVVPAIRGYTALNSLAEFSGAANNRIRGFYATTYLNSTYIFAGDEDKLYEFSATDYSLNDVSKAGGYSLGTDDTWKFVQFGADLIAASGLTDPLQTFELGSSTNFADISGSPSAKHLAVVRDFVVTGNIAYGGAEYPDSVRWSQINDATSWTIGANQADVQAIPDAGAVTGLVGGEVGIVLLERGIARMQYVGTPLIFTFEKVETAQGCTYPGSVASIGPSQVFYLSDNGFFMFNGNTSVPIGSEKVNRFFFDDLSSRFYDRMSCTIDPRTTTVMWSYPSTNSTGDPDRVLIYNYAIQRWSLAEIDHQFIGTIQTPAESLENLVKINTNIELINTSFDDKQFAGGLSLLVASKDNKIHTFTGQPLDAVIETAEVEFAKGQRSTLRFVRPYVSTRATVPPEISVEVGSRSSHKDVPSFGAVSQLNDDNMCPVRANGRYHRFRVNISGRWRYALGVDVDGSAVGRR